MGKAITHELVKLERLLDGELHDAAVAKALEHLGAPAPPRASLLPEARIYNDYLPKAAEVQPTQRSGPCTSCGTRSTSCRMSVVVDFAIPFRRMIAERLFRRCGADFIADEGVRFNFGQLLEVGDDVFLNRGVFLDTKGGVGIGDAVCLTEWVAVFTHSHSEARHVVRTYRAGRHLEPYAKVYSDAIILPGVTVGDEAIVGGALAWCTGTCRRARWSPASRPPRPRAPQRGPARGGAGARLVRRGARSRRSAPGAGAPWPAPSDGRSRRRPVAVVRPAASILGAHVNATSRRPRGDPRPASSTSSPSPPPTPSARARFYVETLGLRPDPKGHYEFWVGQTCFGIWEPGKAGMQFAPQTTAHLALHVDDVAAARAELEERASRSTATPSTPGVCHMALFTDPDGNSLMLHHRYKPRPERARRGRPGEARRAARCTAPRPSRRRHFRCCGCPGVGLGCAGLTGTGVMPARSPMTLTSSPSGRHDDLGVLPERLLHRLELAQHLGVADEVLLGGLVDQLDGLRLALGGEDLGLLDALRLLDLGAPLAVRLRLAWRWRSRRRRSSRSRP